MIPQTSKLPSSGRARWAWAAAVLIAGALGVYFRLYPLTVFPRDLSQNTARLMIAVQMRHTAEAQITRLNPGIPSSEATRRANALVSKKIQTDPGEFRKLVDRQAAALERETRAVTHGGYLLEVDPYYYMSQTERILTTGRLAEKTRGREFLNPMTLAPGGYWYPMDLHPFVGAWLYRAVKVMLPKTELVAVLRWVPLLVALSALAVFAWFCRKGVGITGWPGFLGMAFLMLCPMFLKRSLVGWYDTDPYNILFPLIALIGIYIAFGPAASARSRWAAACAAGCGFALHALFWRGWMIPFLVIFLFLTMGLLIPRSRRPQDLPRHLHALLLIPVSLIPFAALFAVWGFLGVRQEAVSAVEFIRGFLQPDFRPWPDVFITVGELKPMNFWELTGLLGGAAWVTLTLTGLALCVLRRVVSRTDEKNDLIPLFVLLAICCAGVAVSLRIQRFSILAAAPLAVAVPFAWAEWRERVRAGLPWVFAPHAVRALNARFHFIWAAVTLAALVFLGARAHAEIVHFYPIYNTAWDRMMTQIREKTPENAIVTSWWSPGHFLTSMGKRRVTFDGSSQNEPQAYWVANLFIENSERTALGILRMLDTSGNAAVDYLTARNFSLSDAVDLIKSIVPLSREDARNKLVRRFSSSDADGLLDLTHGRASEPPAYLFVYNHMIEQALALEFIGRWNFKKAEAFETYLKQQPQDVDHRLLARATPQNTSLLWAMSEKPTFYQTEGYATAKNGSAVAFSNGVRMNLETRDTEIRGNAQINGRPSSVFWVNQNNELIETPLANPTLNVSVLLIEDKPKNPGGQTTYRSVIMGRRFAGSVAMRLYYLGGRGLRMIHPVSFEDSAANRTRLGLFEVDWKAFEELLRQGS